MTDQHQVTAIDALAALPCSRALVVMDSSRSTAIDDRPGAVFLTQLIACDRRLPAYRDARKAEPNAAAVAYARPAETSTARFSRVI